MMMGDEAIEDPTSLIVKAIGNYKNCTFTLIVTCTNTDYGSSETDTDSFESKFVPLSPPPRSFYFEFDSTAMYPSVGTFDEINEVTDSSYPFVFEINCVYPDDEGIELEGDIPKELRSLIEREDERHA